MTRHGTHILLIDDDTAVLEMVQAALSHYGMEVHAYPDAAQAVDFLQTPGVPEFDLVISDINMEGLDGFDVIHKVKATQPHLPVVLMTGQASVEYAIRAMRMGASNLFMKPIALRDLVQNVFHLVDLHRELRLADNGLRGLVNERRHFLFRSDELDVPSLMHHLTDRLVPMGFASASNIDVIAMAFHEALVNALEHGNFELDSALKGDLFAVEDPYTALRAKRLEDPHYAGRLIEVRLAMDTERFELEISDEGRGFDAGQVSPLPPDSEMAPHCGRGLPLILLVMDEVHFNEKGNQIRMVLRRK
ncbi:two-component system response regulator [Geothrix oryzae]|uniref:Two-component system response regulator n=1 Tax=Geothrix oryzae TaxID=2927975 RepID=A0ABM8DS82_9BACT|nr:response regulator [Geothrix oryzae]BDU69860.1 two-component system response regulator [Geothrix oryzae]